MAKLSKQDQQKKRIRQTRCERCILMHRCCDGGTPTCTTCASHRNGPLDCFYPEGQPSRSELKKRKMDEAAAQKQKLEEQAANRKAAGITYGFGEGKYGTVPPSWPEKYGGLGGYQQMIDAAAASKKRGSEAMGGEKVSEEEKRKRRRLEKKDYPIAGVSRGESPEQEIDIAQGFPSLGGGAPTTGPMEVRAPVAPSLGTPWDPYINPDWFKNPTPLTLQMIGRNLAKSLEKGMPVHGSGVLKGRTDWSKVVTQPPTTKEGQEEEFRKVIAIQRRIIPVLMEREKQRREKYKKEQEKKDRKAARKARKADKANRGLKDAQGDDGITVPGEEVENVDEN